MPSYIMWVNVVKNSKREKGEAALFWKEFVPFCWLCAKKKKRLTPVGRGCWVVNTHKKERDILFS